MQSKSTLITKAKAKNYRLLQQLRQKDILTCRTSIKKKVIDIQNQLSKIIGMTVSKG
eukprot:UN27002